MNSRVISLGNYALKIEEETGIKENIINETINEYEEKIKHFANENEDLKKQLQNISFTHSCQQPPYHQNSLNLPLQYNPQSKTPFINGNIMEA